MDVERTNQSSVVVSSRQDHWKEERGRKKKGLNCCFGTTGSTFVCPRWAKLNYLLASYQDRGRRRRKRRRGGSDPGRMEFVIKLEALHTCWKYSSWGSNFKCVAQWLAYLLLDPATGGLIPIFPHFFRGKIINIAEIYQWLWLEESGQRLENVDWTHLELASGKPVLQNFITFNQVSDWTRLCTNSNAAKKHRCPLIKFLLPDL